MRWGGAAQAIAGPTEMKTLVELFPVTSNVEVGPDHLVLLAMHF